MSGTDFSVNFSFPMDFENNRESDSNRSIVPKSVKILGKYGVSEKPRKMYGTNIDQQLFYYAPV